VPLLFHERKQEEIRVIFHEIRRLQGQAWRFKWDYAILKAVLDKRDFDIIP
jgi:hypothetical protein